MNSTSLLVIFAFLLLSVNAGDLHSSKSELNPTVSRHLWKLRAPISGSISNTYIPQAPTPLPPPDSTLSLLSVAIGRGVQNYTCASPNPNDIPLSVGAMANLYDATYLATYCPAYLSILPGLALQADFPGGLSLWATNLNFSGFHFFATNTTPVFNLTYNPDPLMQLGVVVGKKDSNSTAPTTSIAGVRCANDGAVDWLKIVATNATVGNVRNVYRLNTAGGDPPKDCSGMPPTFSVDYAAEYWFWVIEEAGC